MLCDLFEETIYYLVVILLYFIYEARVYSHKVFTFYIILHTFYIIYYLKHIMLYRIYVSIRLQ